MLLDTVTRTLEIVLDGAPSAQFPWVACYAQLSAGSNPRMAPAASNGATNSTTPVTLVSAPASGFQRLLNYLSVYNAANASRVVTIQLNDNGTPRIVWKGTLGVGEQLQYVDGDGFVVLNTDGRRRYASVYIAHAASHQNAGADEIGIVGTSPNAIPKADSSGKLDTWISEAASGVAGKIKLAGDLGGTAAAVQAVGLMGGALPAAAANVFYKRNAANSAWETAVYGTTENTVAQGNDARFFTNVVPPNANRILRPHWNIGGHTFSPSSGAAFFQFMGVVRVSTLYQYVEYGAMGAVTSMTAGEVGLFSTANPPYGGYHELTRIEAQALQTMSSAGVYRNSTAFTTPVPAGTYLWAGIRYAASNPGTQWAADRYTVETGHCLWSNAIVLPFTTATMIAWSGQVPIGTTGNQCLGTLSITMD